MDRATEDRESLMCRFSKDRWLVARDKECKDAQRRWIVVVSEAITSDVQAMVVEFDQDSSITDVKNTLAGELRSVGRSSSVSMELPMSASAAIAVMEKFVPEMQSTVRTIVAHVEWVYSTTSGLGQCNFDLDCGFRGTCGQSSVPKLRTACERRKRAAAKRWSSSMSW